MNEMIHEVTTKEGKYPWLWKTTLEFKKFKLVSNLYLTWFNMSLNFLKILPSYSWLPDVLYTLSKGKWKEINSFCSFLALLLYSTERINKPTLFLELGWYKLMVLVPKPRCGGRIRLWEHKFLLKGETTLILSPHITNLKLKKNRKEKITFPL